METLGAAVDHKDRVLHVVSRIRIDDEVIHVVSEPYRGRLEDNHHRWTVLRGMEGTTAAPHLAGAVVEIL